MSKKNSLEQYALFYEKIENKRPENPVSEIKKENSYEKAPSLTKEQVKALSNDLRTPVKNPYKLNKS